MLTFSKLFQMKEWRSDRLREHLRREGWLTQLFGTSRLLVLALTIPSLLTPFHDIVLLASLSALAALSLVQFALRRQPTPVWTRKAMMVTTLSFMLSMATVYATFFTNNGTLWLPLIAVGQPAFVIMAWAALLPLDGFLKRKVMRRAADMRATFPELQVIGIAGSVGKTTTKELIHHLLQDLHPITTPAHVNTEMGVAQWLTNQLKTENSKLKTLLIVEMGAYREGEIALLCDIAQPTIGVLTALGSDHLALFGSEEAIRRANTELILSLPEDGQAFILATDEDSKNIAAQSPCPAVLVGPEGEKKPEKIEAKKDGLHVTVDGNVLHLPLQGVHNAQNLMLAVSVARHLGVSWDRIRDLLPSFRAASHTFSVYEEQGVTILDDTYNISFLSFEAALRWAKDRTERPRVLVTNGLLEVGDLEHEYHAKLGEIANGCIEHAVFLNGQAAKAFGETFKGEVTTLENTEKVPKGSVLLCIGRMPLSVIHRLLP